MKNALLAGMAAYMAAAAAASTVPPYGAVRMRGPMGARLDAMIERHVKSTDVEYITSPFMEKTERRNWWQTEFWGKYMHAAVPFWAYTQDASLRRSIDLGVERILSSQEPSGYIGNYPDELRYGEGWDVWGMKYTLMGLMHYYDGVTGNGERGMGNGERGMGNGKKALDGACRLCDYVISQLGPND